MNLRFWRRIGNGLIRYLRPDGPHGYNVGLRPLSAGTYWRTVCVNELARYLVEHLVLDFDGALTIDELRKFLRDEDSREARHLLTKLIEDKGVDNLMVTVADCLKDHIRTGINEAVVRQQLNMYSES